MHIATLANAILVIHFALVLFTIGGLPLIYLGAWRRWLWVRNRRWRLLHLIAIAIVALESVARIPCPLTVWEDALRANQAPTGFIERWVTRVMFFDLPSWVFTLAYVAFAVLVSIAWMMVRPTMPGHSCDPVRTGRHHSHIDPPQ